MWSQHRLVFTLSTATQCITMLARIMHFLWRIPMLFYSDLFIYLLQWFILQYTNQWIQFICNCCRCSSRLKLKVECYYNSQTSIQDHKSKRDVTKLSSMNCWLSVPLVSGARFLIRIHPLWSFFKYRFVLTPLFLFLLRYSASVQCLELIFIFFNDIDPISKSQVDYV